MTCLWLRGGLLNPWQGLLGRRWVRPFVLDFHSWGILGLLSKCGCGMVWAFIAHAELALSFSHTLLSLGGITKSPQISWEDPEVDLGTYALTTLCPCQAEPSCLP